MRALWMHEMPCPYRQLIVFILRLVIDVTFQLCRGKVRDEEDGCSALLRVLSGNELINTNQSLRVTMGLFLSNIERGKDKER